MGKPLANAADLKHPARQQSNRAENKGRGRPSKVETFVLGKHPKYEMVCDMIMRGMSHRDISVVLGGHRSMVYDWLSKGEYRLQEKWSESDPFIKFYKLWGELRADGRLLALKRLQDSKEDKMVERWLTRTDDNMDYYDRDRLVGRPEINVGVINAGDNVDWMGSLARAKAANGMIGSVEGQYRELGAGDDDDEQADDESEWEEGDWAADGEPEGAEEC